MHNTLQEARPNILLFKKSQNKLCLLNIVVLIIAKF